MYRLFLIVACLVSASSASLAAEMQQPAPDIAPERVVKIQLTALQNNDEPTSNAGIEQTWVFAHPKNKSFTGPLERFTAMIKAPPYRMLVGHESHSVRRIAVTDDTAMFAVEVTPASGDPVVYQWKLEKTGSGSWMTIGVSPPADRGDTI